MATHYSPNPTSKELGLDLPFDFGTGEILEKVWNRWLSCGSSQDSRKVSEQFEKTEACLH